MSGLYGDIVIKNVGLSWASTQILVQVVGSWDLYTWEEKKRLSELARERQKEARSKKEDSPKNEAPETLF